MSPKNLLLRSVLWMGLFFSDQVYAQECFHVILPANAKKISVPPIRSRQTPQGEETNPPGFDLFRSGGNLALNGPACFFLEQDIVRHVSRLGNFLGEPGGFGPLVELNGSDIKFDLNGHTLRSNRAGTAIEARVWGKLQEPRKKNLSFYNGSIEISGSGIVMRGWQYGGEWHNYKPGPDQIARAISWYGQDFREFGDTNILLENLTIKSGSLAAYLVGRNNIIRHCRIEVEGHEAVALFGARTQLIDNEIIVKRRLLPPKTDNSMPELGTYYSEYAAIWIRDAPGAIIRGNKITIEGFSNAREAILLINSPDVVIENNDITGSDKLYTALDDQSSAHAHDNRKRFGKWPNTSARPISPGD